MQYFDVTVPRNSGLCSDDACPCDSTVIPVGGGHLYIPSDCCEFRRDCPTKAQVEAKMDRISRQSGQFMIFGHGVVGPILCCEAAARRRNLDMSIAAADAKHWWETGKVPYRPTPQAGQPKIAVSSGSGASHNEAESGRLAYPLDRELTEAFVRVQSGDIDGGRAILARVILRSNCTLDALCFAAWELSRYPGTTEPCMAAVNTIRARFPHWGALRAVLFSIAPIMWSQSDIVEGAMKSAGKEPAQGPHEAAVRLFAMVAACDRMIFMISADDYLTRKHATECVLVRGGATCLANRDARSALELFRDGIGDVDTQMRVISRDLGQHYRQDSREVGRLMLLVACLAGEVLALRDLGMFAEACTKWQELGRRIPELAWALSPLIAEAEQLRGSRAYPTDWRIGFANEAHQVAKDAARMMAKDGKPNQGCALVMAMLLLSSAAAWRVIAA